MSEIRIKRNVWALIILDMLVIIIKVIVDVGRFKCFFSKKMHSDFIVKNNFFHEYVLTA